MAETDGGPPPPHPVTASIVLGLAVGVFGVSFGVLAVASGLSVAQASAMSLLVFTGASQFEAPAGAISAAAIIVTIPVVLLVLAFQRQIVSGLTQGAVK